MNMRVDELFAGAEQDQQQQRQAPEGEQAAMQPGGEGAPSQEGATPAQGGGQPTPEQQEAYDRVVMAGLTVLTELTDDILQMLQQQVDNMPQGIADTTLMIVQQLDEKAGGQIPKDVLFHASLEILENVVEFALQAGIGEVTKQTQTKAGQLLLMGLADTYGPEMTRFMEGAMGMLQELPKEEYAAILREQAGMEEGGGEGGGQPKPPPNQEQGLIARQMRG